MGVRDAPLHGRVTVLAGLALLYVPDPDFFGDDIFTYAVSDGRLSSGEATVTVTVNPVNDQPKFAAASVTRTVVDGAQPGSPVGAPVTADDIDDDPLAYGLFDVDASLFAIDAVTGQITVAARHCHRPFGPAQLPAAGPSDRPARRKSQHLRERDSDRRQDKHQRAAALAAAGAVLRRAQR